MRYLPKVLRQLTSDQALDTFRFMCLSCKLLLFHLINGRLF